MGRSQAELGNECATRGSTQESQATACASCHEVSGCGIRTRHTLAARRADGLRLVAPFGCIAFEE